MTTNHKDKKPHWTFDWTTLSFTYHDPDKVLPIFVEGSRARKIYLVTLWTLVIVGKFLSELNQTSDPKYSPDCSFWIKRVSRQNTDFVEFTSKTALFMHRVTFSKNPNPLKA